MRRGLAATLAALAAGGALSGGYVAAGGGSFTPARTADPCLTRPWTAPDGVAEVAQQIALSAFDGGACSLGVPREELVLAFRSRVELERFAARHDVTDDAVVAAIRRGLDRAITDSERNGGISGEAAGVLRTLAAGVPVTLLFDLLRGTSLRW